MFDWIIKKATNSIPEEFDWYIKACDKNVVLSQAISEARFVVLDTETTGLDPKKDRILSIGAVAVQGYSLKVNDSFEVALKQSQFNKESIAVHEITPGSSALAEEPKSVMTDFLNYLKGAVIIGHYVDFDYKILSEAVHRQLGFHLLNKRYDTMQLLRRTDTHFAYNNLNKPSDFGLDQVCERFNIPISDRHTAMGDALATSLLFARQLKKLEHRGINTVKDLLKR